MITVSIKELVASIEEATAFKLPDMNEGTSYLYDRIYTHLSQGTDVRLSDIDFDSFEEDDITTRSHLHTNVFEQNIYTARGITSTLQKIAPTCKAVGYV